MLYELYLDLMVMSSTKTLTHFEMVQINFQFIKRLDSIIDLSRSTLQLEIVLHLLRKDRVTILELSHALMQRKKALYDSLRKLKIKGLVGGEEGGYWLTDYGREQINKLLNILGYSESPSPSFLSIWIQKTDWWSLIFQI